jgi:hypothetical protein
VTKCTPKTRVLPRVAGRKIEVNFSGGDVSSDGGAILLREMDRRLRLTREVAMRLPDDRAGNRLHHSMASLLRQRIFALALGYEDLNDHDQLRHDPCFQTAVGRDEALASSATLCRFENRADRQTAWRIHEVLVEQFIASFKTPPRELILDLDATDDMVHGRQVGRYFHGFYDHYCFLPLYVFCGEKLLAAYLRPSSCDGAKHAWAVIALLAKRLRRAWPSVRLVIRADSGFCRHRMLAWLDRKGVGYIVGLAKNSRLNALVRPQIEQARSEFMATGRTGRVFGELEYAAGTWKEPRRVIARIEHSAKGDNPRYVVTNLCGDGRHLYEKVYCHRGEMENRIKEQQLHLYADRTSCHAWWPNQFRLLLSSLAYVLLEGIRRICLKETELRRAQCATIRNKLLKIGTVVLRNTRRVRLMFSSSYPFQELFWRSMERLHPG